MANVTARLKLLHEQHRRVAPLFSQIYMDDYRHSKELQPYLGNTTLHHYSQHHSFANETATSLQDKNFAFPCDPIFTKFFCRSLLDDRSQNLLLQAARRNSGSPNCSHYGLFANCSFKKEAKSLLRNKMPLFPTRGQPSTRSLSCSNFSDDHIDSTELQLASKRNSRPLIFLQHRFFANMSRDKRCVIPMGCPTFTRNYSARNFSSSSTGVEITEKTDIVRGVLTHVLVDNEVSIAAADSSYPVAMLQFFIENVHNFTGLNWWTSIMVATILTRTLLFPIMINQRKATFVVKLLDPRLDAIFKEMKEKINDEPSAFIKGHARMGELYKEYGITPFTPFIRSLVSFPIYSCLFSAIWNMAEKVPAFTYGGMLWFTDLSTPDTTCILPILTALSYWIPYKLNTQYREADSPMAVRVSWAIVALIIAWTATLPKALFCFWITYNMFSTGHGLVVYRARKNITTQASSKLAK